MADEIDFLRDKVKELEAVIKPTIRDSIDKNSDELIAIQTDDQLAEGEDSDGNKIKPPYTEFTKNLKRIKKQPINKVTWKDTGALYNNLKVDARANEAEIDAPVPYIDDLEKKYGENVLGIQVALLDEFFNDYILPDLKERYEQITKP